MKQLSFFLLLLTFAITFEVSGSLKLITFRAKYATEKDLSSTVYNNFETWFNSPETKEQILKANPGIEKIEKVQSDFNYYIADLSPIHFPGLLLKTRVKFQCLFDNNSLIVKCHDRNMERKYEGSRFFASIVSKLFPEVISTSSYGYIPERKLFFNNAELIINFHLPSWFPIGGEMVERKGSEAIQKGLVKDLQKTVDGVISMYRKSFPSP
eukprot:gene2427-2578_t